MRIYDWSVSLQFNHSTKHFFHGRNNFHYWFCLFSPLGGMSIKGNHFWMQDKRNELYFWGISPYLDHFCSFQIIEVSCWQTYSVFVESDLVCCNWCRGHASKREKNRKQLFLIVKSSTLHSWIFLQLTPKPVISKWYAVLANTKYLVIK